MIGSIDFPRNQPILTNKEKNMKRLVVSLFLLLAIAAPSFAGYVSGYSRGNGTYVQSYYRSDYNNTVRDNYSYYGNTNPYTGSSGSNYYRGSKSSEYYRGY